MTTATRYLDQLTELEALGADLSTIPGRAKLEQIVDRQHEIAAHRAAAFNNHETQLAEATRLAAEGGSLDDLIPAAQRATVTRDGFGVLGALYTRVSDRLDRDAVGALAAPEAVWLDVLRPLVEARVHAIRQDIPASVAHALSPAGSDRDRQRANTALLAGREQALRAHAELRTIYRFAHQLRTIGAIPGKQYPAEAFEWRASLGELGTVDETLTTFVRHMANGYDPALLTVAEVAAYDNAAPSSRVDMTRARTEAAKARNAGGISHEAAARF